MNLKKAAKEICKYLPKDMCFYDLETTGLDVNTAEIVQFHAIKIKVDGKVSELSLLFKPNNPIPKAASDVHGITDNIVLDAPKFEEKANEIDNFFLDCDINGYNSTSYDNKILDRVMAESGYNNFLGDRRQVDTFSIYKKHSSRKLADAVKFYLNEELEDAHDAKNDITATVCIFAEQLKKENKPLDEILNADKIASDQMEIDKRFIKGDNGEYIMNFGKNKGMKCKDVDKGFYNWLIRSDFPDCVKTFVRQYL